MTTSEEKQAIKKILRGDTFSFKYFVDAYQDMAINIAFRICENRQDAEDIVQNSFVKAFHNLHTFQSQSKFSTWFYRIVYNTSITHISSSSFKHEAVDYSELNTQDSYSDLNTIENIEKEERSKIINEAMNKLSREESLLLTLYYLEENSIKEISLITGLSETNVKVKMHRGRKRLAENISIILKQEEI